jgi:hypothetical protein
MTTRSDEIVTMTRRRVTGYAAAALLGAAVAVSAASPASAHTGITIDPARAGAKNAVATINAEAESDSAGVTKMQIFLPAGIAPDDVTQISLPNRWKLTRQLTSYTVEGAALAVGRNAEHKIRIRQLPMYASISFKVLQTYSDGRTDRWIGLGTKDNPAPDNPAPTVKLAGGSGTAPDVSTTAPASPSAEATTTPSTPPASAAAAPQIEPVGDSQQGVPVWWWVAGLLVLAILAVGMMVTVRRRRRSA